MKKYKCTKLNFGWVVTLIVFCFFSCSNPNKHKNGIKEIEIATGYCHGECPFIAIHVDSTLKYYYYGGDYAKKKGYYTGQISEDLWKKLNRQFEQINYQQLDTVYNHTVDDQSLEVFIHYGDKVKHIRAQAESMPKNVRNLLYEVVSNYKNVELQPTNTIIKFDTQVQFVSKPNKPMFSPISN